MKDCCLGIRSLLCSRQWAHLLSLVTYSAQNNPYVTEAYFRVMYSATLQGQPLKVFKTKAKDYCMLFKFMWDHCLTSLRAICCAREIEPGLTYWYWLLIRLWCQLSTYRWLMRCKWFLSHGYGFLACGHHLFLYLFSILVSAIPSFTGYIYRFPFKPFHCLGNRLEWGFVYQFMQIFQQSYNGHSQCDLSICLQKS